MAKTATKKTTKPATKRNGTAKKNTAKPRAARKTVTGKTKTVAVQRIKNPKWEKAAKLATALVTVGSDGKSINRAPISTPKVEMVATQIVGRKSASAVIKSLGFKNTKQATDYAGAKIGRTDLPDGVSRQMSEAAASMGSPAVHKINGRALAAVLVALAK
jgi:hypothetical protein